MRLSVIGLSLLLALVTQAAGETVIRNVNVVDVARGQVRAGLDVVIDGSKIVNVGADAAGAGTATVVDGAGKFLIPGLWDFHVHVFSAPGEEDFALPLYILNGVTGIRDVGAFRALEEQKVIAEAAERGERVGPRMVLAGAVIDGPPGAWPTIKVAASPEEGRALVREFKSLGWNFIKTYSLVRPDVYAAIADEAAKQGMKFFGHIPEGVALADAVSQGHGAIEHFSRITMACSRNEPEILARRRAAMTPSASLNDILSVMRETHPLALRDHDDALCGEVIQSLLRAGTWVMPSLIVADFYMGRDPAPDDPRLLSVPLEVRNKWSQQDFRRGEQSEDDKKEAADGVRIEYGVFRRAAAAGVRFLAGSDAAYINPFIFHGHSIHDELARYVQNGMSPAAALATATLNPATYLGREDSMGRVADGHVADLVLLNENPLENIAATRAIHAVIANGRLFDRAALDALRREVEAWAEK